VFSAQHPPVTCRNGHPLGPRKVKVGFAHCSCDRARAGGHLSWYCLVCGDEQYADGHVDDAQLLTGR